ncbi:MAG: hypothetical protein ACRD21_11190, partial [Vicinamibacteria bacterium]
MSASLLIALIFLIFVLMLKMRGVSVALDREVLNLTEAAALADKGGEKTIVETFHAAEATLRDVLGVPAAALLEVEPKKRLLVLTAQY